MVNEEMGRPPSEGEDKVLRWEGGVKSVFAVTRKVDHKYGKM